MSQAADYVGTLERINAVGMSIQIIDSITDDDMAIKCKRNIEMTPLCKVEVTLPRVRLPAAHQRPGGTFWHIVARLPDKPFPIAAYMDDRKTTAE